MKIKCKTSKATIILLLIVTIITSISLVACKTKEEEVPWWKDYTNIEICLEDERSEEKSFSYKNPFEDRINFTYYYDSSDTEEYIPKVRILYKGVEKEIYTFIYKREYFLLYPDGIDWDNPEVSVIVKDPKQYGVHLECFLNKEDADANKNKIAGQYIYINVKEKNNK